MNWCEKSVMAKIVTRDKVQSKHLHASNPSIRQYYKWSSDNWSAIKYELNQLWNYWLLTCCRVAVIMALTMLQTIMTNASIYAYFQLKPLTITKGKSSKHFPNEWSLCSETEFSQDKLSENNDQSIESFESVFTAAVLELWCMSRLQTMMNVESAK